MNTQKKITAEVALEDFKKVMLFNLVNKIQYFFRGDYRAFWTAKDRFIKFRDLCEKHGQQTPQLTHKVYNDLERFDHCSLSLEAVKACMRGVPNYSKMIEKYLVTPHGTLMVKKPDGTIKRMSYGNIYRPETLDELAEVFKDAHSLQRFQNTKSNFYTKRQKRIIIKYIMNGKADKADDEEPTKEVKLTMKVKIPVRCMKYQEEAPCTDLKVNHARSEYDYDEIVMPRKPTPKPEASQMDMEAMVDALINDMDDDETPPPSPRREGPVAKVETPPLEELERMSDDEAIAYWGNILDDDTLETR